MTDTVTDQECPECGATPDEQQEIRHDADCREATRAPELQTLGTLLDEATGDQRVLLSLAYLGYLFKDADHIELVWAADARCLQVRATYEALGQMLELDPEDDCAASNLEEGNAEVWSPYLGATVTNTHFYVDPEDLQTIYDLSVYDD